MTTKTKNKLKKALKAEVKGELESQKEAKIAENRKLNANLKEVVIYTKETCPYCISFLICFLITQAYPESYNKNPQERRLR